jgi:hypothetical protein
VLLVRVRFWVMVWVRVRFRVRVWVRIRVRLGFGLPKTLAPDQKKTRRIATETSSAAGKGEVLGKGFG